MKKLGIFKLDNNYYDSIITLKDEKIEYLENEINNITEFSKNLDRIDYNYKVSKIVYKESYNIESKPLISKMGAYLGIRLKKILTK